MVNRCVTNEIGVQSMTALCRVYSLFIIMARIFRLLKKSFWVINYEDLRNSLVIIFS